MTTRHRLARTLVAVAIVGSIGAFAASPALADDAAGDLTWGVQPSSPTGPDGRTEFSYQVAPGTIITDWVGVTNDSAVPATFRVYAADATTDYDTAAFTLIGADQASTQVGAWTSLDGRPSMCPTPAPGTATADAAAATAACAATLGTTVTLDPGSHADIPFTLTVPFDATPGDHSGGIVASYTTAAPGGTGVAREDRVGTRIYLRVDGALTPGLGLTGAVAGYDGTWNPVGAGAGFAGFDITNTGNTGVSAQPEVRFTGPFGIDFGTLVLAPVKNIVPGGTAHVTGTLPGIPPFLLLFADIRVTPLAGDGVAASDPLPASVSTSALSWAVPWALLVVVAVVAGVIVAVVILRRRSRERLAEDLAAYADQIRAEARADTSESETVR